MSEFIGKQVRYSFYPPTNPAGVTNFFVYAKTGYFNTTGVPSGDLVSILGPNTYQGAFVPETTGIYQLRIYSYNSDSNIFSPTPLSGSILVEGIQAITEISISSLRMVNYTGAYGNNIYGKKSITVTTPDPIFTWQAGLNEGVPAQFDWTYRVTIRPITTTPYPSNTTLYTQTGIFGTRSGLQFSFPFDTNAAITNGPYRNYDVVVEAITPDGRTSAGNDINNLSGQSNWGQYPNGYDVMEVKNLPPTGIVLTSGQLSGTYASYSWMDQNWGLNINFSTGTFEEDVVGGYIYSTNSTGLPFSPMDISTGTDAFLHSKGIKRTQFAFTPDLTHVYAPYAVNPRRGGFQGGYMAVSFFDTFDLEYKNNGIRISTGLNISNVIAFSGEHHTTMVNSSDGFAAFNPNNTAHQGTFKVLPRTGGYKIIFVDSGNAETIVGNY